MKSAPIAACEVDSNIEPLVFRREAAALEMVEQYRRSDGKNPNKQITHQWKSNDRLKRKSALKIEKELQEKHHLPNNREQITRACDEIPPNKMLHSAVTRPNLIENITKNIQTKHS